MSTANGTYLADILDTTGSPNSVENLAEICEAQITKCEEQWGVVISCLVTDNAANMFKLRKLEKNSSETPLHTFGCQPQAVNLLIKDIVSQTETKSVTTQVTSIAKFVRNSHLALAELTKLDIPKQTLPVETRWNSIKKLIAHYEKQFQSIALCVQNVAKSTDKVYQYTEEIQLRREYKNLLVFFEPATNNLNNLQK